MSVNYDRSLKAAAAKDRHHSGLRTGGVRRTAIGTFTQEDPIGLAGGLNLYGFANGDPVNFSDPFGLSPWLWAVRIVPAVVGAARWVGARGLRMWDAARSFFQTPAVQQVADDALQLADDAAQQTGRHAGYVAEMAKRTPGEVARAVRSLERVAAQHAEWIQNPTSKVADFYQRSAAEQASLLRQWGQTVVDRTQQANLLRDLQH